MAKPGLIKYSITALRTALITAVFLFLTQPVGNTSAEEADPGPVPLRQMLEKITFDRTVTLENSCSVYNNIICLYRRDPEIAFTLPCSSYEFYCRARIISLEESVDKVTVHTFTFKKGSTLMAAVREVADFRKDKIQDDSDYFIIYAASLKLTDPKSHKLKAEAPESQGILKAKVEERMVPGLIRLECMDAEGLQDFLTMKLSQVATGNVELQTHLNAPYIFRMDATAGAFARRLNIMGNWSFREMLECVCSLTDLRWRIDGDTVRLEKAPVSP